MERDGKDKKRPGGGHNIKDNSALQVLINKVAEDYLRIVPTILTRRYDQKLFKRKKQQENDGLVETNSYQRIIRTTENKVEPSSVKTYLFQQEAIRASKRALKDIKESDVFMEELRRMGHDMDDAESVESGCLFLLNSIIKHAVNAAHEYVVKQGGYEHDVYTINRLVPMSFDQKEWGNSINGDVLVTSENPSLTPGSPSRLL